jgi:hypothetical protein
MGRGIPIAIAALGLLSGGHAQAADVIVNEYNAVREDLYLQGTAEDPYLGRRLENGGDWFEVVVISDHLDMRGWDFVVTNNTGETPCGEPLVPPCEETFVLGLTLADVWFDMRSGTIITVSEDIPNNVEAYQPETGSWWINVRADANTTGTFISPLNFKVSNDKSQITIRNEFDQVIFGPAGEGVAPLSGVGNDEVCKLEADPTGSITPTSTYNDGKSSTYGAPNVWTSGTMEQDFSALRGVVPYSPLTSVVINEVNIHTDLPDEDWIELYNTTGSPVDISGWFLSDRGLCHPQPLDPPGCVGLTKYAIPASTIVPADGYVVFTETDLGFALKSIGDDAFLSEGNGSTMTGARNFMEFGAIENGVSWGRFPNGSGPVYRMKSRTQGAANDVPDMSPVVINELMYNPPAPGVLLTQNELEFVELYNASSSPVDLFRDFGGAGVFPWKLSWGVEFEFCDTDAFGQCLPSTGITISGHGYLVVVSFDPVAEPTKLAEFRSHYGIDPSVQILGPYSFGLNDFTDRIQLVSPDTPNAGVAPPVLYDEVAYFDFREWPTEPDGGGPSLERRNPGSVGNVPSNWAASLSVGGTPGLRNSIITFPLGVPSLDAWGLMLLVLALLGAGALVSRRHAAGLLRARMGRAAALRRSVETE